jgi:hypothetical protein
MRRFVLALAVAALATIFLATPAAACPTCFDARISLQTPDGQPWSDGKPVTVVVSTQRPEATVLPASGVVVVMRTDGDRTKCLEVPLKLVRSDGGGATYAGIFYPFRAAAYDGKLQLGDETTDISFDVRAMSASAPVAPQADLPVGTTEEPDGFALPRDLAPVAAAGAALLFVGLGVLLYRRTPAVTA